MHPAIRRVVVTGSESTGKTTLARDLARHYATVWVPEYSRSYAEAKRSRGEGALGAGDVEPIARGQIAAEDDGLRRAVSIASGGGAPPPLIVLDTDLLSTVVYSRHYYGACPPWIERASRERRGDLYLLCDIDVPWLPDPARDRPDHREEMHALFAGAVSALGAPCAVIRGSWDERFTRAAAAVRAMLAQ